LAIRSSASIDSRGGPGIPPHRVDFVGDRPVLQFGLILGGDEDPP
jgi:hypothetical protein